MLAKFHVDGLTGMTLSVRGTAAKPIRNWRGDPAFSDPDTIPKAGKVGHLMYDALMDAWMKVGGDVAHSDFFLHNGVPPTLMFRLCAETGTHPHFAFRTMH